MRTKSNTNRLRSRRNHHHNSTKPMRTLLAKTVWPPLVLLLSVALLVAFAPGATAHAPTDITLQYDRIEDTLTVEIDHPVTDTSTHYIERIVIEKNGEPYASYNYSSQSNPQGATYVYDISSAEGDILTVTVYCSISGTDTATLTVPAESADQNSPEITILHPGPEDTVHEKEINASGTAADEEQLDRVEVRLNDGQWRRADGTDTWEIDLVLRQGENTITARAYDTAENWEEVSITVIYEPEEDEGEGEGDGGATPALGFAPLAMSVALLALLAYHYRTRR